MFNSKILLSINNQDFPMFFIHETPYVCILYEKCVCFLCLEYSVKCYISCLFHSEVFSSNIFLQCSSLKEELIAYNPKKKLYNNVSTALLHPEYQQMSLPVFSPYYYSIVKTAGKKIIKLILRSRTEVFHFVTQISRTSFNEV